MVLFGILRPSLKFCNQTALRVFLLALVGIFALGGQAHADPKAEGVTKSSQKLLRDTLGRYQKAGMVSLKVEKKVVSELLGRERKHSGKLLLAKKRFRFETEDPDRVLVLFDGKYLWNVQYPSIDSEGKIQAARARLDKKNQGQILMSDLLVGQSVLTHFNLLSESSEGRELTIVARPKKKDDQISDLKITIDPTKKEIVELSYTDELGNKTSMRFLDSQFSVKLQAKTFEYAPEKGAEVTDL